MKSFKFTMKKVTKIYILTGLELDNVKIILFEILKNRTIFVRSNQIRTKILQYFYTFIGLFMVCGYCMCCVFRHHRQLWWQLCMRRFYRQRFDLRPQQLTSIRWILCFQLSQTGKENNFISDSID